VTLPKTREEIKHAPVSREVWRNNRTQVGGLWFDPRQIRPLGDHILVELDPERPTSKDFAAHLFGCGIIKPDIARNQEIGSRVGTVLAVGPGKLAEKRKYSESWMLNPLVRKPMTLKPGDRVIIGHYSDWESWHADYEGRDANIVLCQEADVRVVLE
jgi:co-chaperonin GroES (HSP10)